MPSAEIITIGTEILLGEIQDTNTAYLARQLMTRGIDLYRTHTVGDNKERIAQSISDSLQRADIVITTGGLGPTVDDVTREAVALSVDENLIFHDQIWHDICGYFDKLSKTPSENNRRQAYLPQNAVAIANPIGTAPGFYIQSGNSVIICVPGVPKEMEFFTMNFILPYIDDHYHDHQVILSKTLHVSGIGESQVDMLIGDFEKMLNPTVGLLAKPGQIDIRVAAKAKSINEAEQLISCVVDQLLLLLEDHVFGCNEETLISAIKKHWISETTFDLIEVGFDGQMITTLNEIPGLISHSEVVKIFKPEKEHDIFVDTISVKWKSQRLISCEFSQENGISNLRCRISENGRYQNYVRKFAGPPENGKQWAINNVLDIFRRYLLLKNEKEI